MKTPESGDTDLKSFSRRLRALRVTYGARVGYMGLTAEVFAKMLGIERARYGRYERGELNPQFSVLITIRRLTGVSLCTLVAGERNGDDDMIPVEGVADREPRLGERLRMVREILEPSVLKASMALRVEAATWAAWESGALQPPIAKMAEFSHQFGDRYNLGLDFLYRGLLAGVKKDLSAELLKRNPSLRERAKRESGGAGARRKRRPARGNKLPPGSGGEGQP